MKDVLIIGSGPAGISAAINIKRANYNVSVITNNQSALLKADKIDNFYGTSGISGVALYKSGLEQALALGCEIITDEVLSLSYGNGFTAITKNGEFNAKALILAAGTSRNTPKIDKIKEFEGKGVSYCAVCDGFFFRGKNVCVLGNGDYALHEAEYLKNIARSVTILTNAKKPEFKIPNDITINEKEILKFDGDKMLEKVIFKNGEELYTNGIFIAEGTASSLDFAKKLGLLTENQAIKTDSKMATNIDGIFAAGDCTGLPFQIAKAVDDGMKAAFSAIEFLKKQ